MKQVETAIEKNKELRYYNMYASGKLEVEAMNIFIINLRELSYNVEVNESMTYQMMMVGDGEFINDLNSPTIPCINVIIRW